MKKIITFLLSVILIAVIAVNKNEIVSFVDGFINTVFISEISDVTDEKITLGSKYKNHFDTLSSEQKRGYNQILTKILTAEKEFPESIEVPMMSGEALTQTFQAVLYDNPEIVAIGRNNQIVTSNNLCYFQPNYTMTPAQQKEMNAELQEKCNEIISQIPSGADEFEKELFIHDYIIENCVYDDAALEKSSTAYSCLVEGYSACEGYSKAAKMLLEAVGIECYTISGKAVDFDGEVNGHMWNIVKIDNEYYHLDVTWDDPTTQDEIQTVSHIFLNVSEKNISIDHSEFTSSFECQSEEANYFNKTDNVLISIKPSQKEKIKKLIASSDGKSVELKFSDKEAFDKANDSLIENGEIYNIISSVNKTYGKNFNTKSIRYTQEKERLVLTIFFD